MILEKGRRYDGVPNQVDFQTMEFDRYGVMVSRQSQALSGDSSARALPTETLLRNPNNFNLGELLWRMSQPIMAVALMLLAIPLSFVNPRAGRSAGLIVALLLFVTYSNAVSVFQANVVQERLSFAYAWWPVHLTVALITASLFLWRLKVNSPRHPAVWWSAVKRAARRRKAVPQ